VKEVLIVAGPTASGKSGLALIEAEKKGGTVINADSLQIYDVLPILTAQPSSADKARAPHKLYGVLKQDDPCSAARWRDMALAEIRKAEYPIVTGGTGFYIKTLIEGISPIPDIAPEYREAAIVTQKEIGNAGLHALLDPATAARLDPHNTQRLVRAYEVQLATGKGIAHFQDLPREGVAHDLRFTVAVLLPPRGVLHAAIETRFRAMLQGGALEEVRAFSGASKALGLAELRAHLAGQITLEEASSRAILATRHYAKRQETWFRHQLKADIVLENPAEGL